LLSCRKCARDTEAFFGASEREHSVIKDIRFVFAVVKTGGKQYKVRVGETIDVEKLAVDTGTQVRLDEVLLASNDGAVAYGRPMIDGAVVTARVVRQYKGPKLIIFKYKSKSRYRRRTGHRQNLTQLYVQTIDIPGLGTDAVAARPRVVVDTPVVPVVEVPAEETVTSASTATAIEAATTAPGLASTFTAQGSAAPAGDVLPAVAPTAQVDAANTGAVAPELDVAGDPTLPTTALPPRTVAPEPLANLPGSGEGPV